MSKTSSVAAELRLLDAFWREPVARSVLPNGLTLIVRPDRSAALASVQVWVRTGSIHEGELLGAGLSHYLEHMLFKGTGRRAGREISAEVQALGGDINAYTTFDRTVYHVDLPSEHTEAAIDLLADMALHASLSPEEAAREKEVILREISMTLDDPDDRLWRAVFETAFREHPYRHPVIGHRDVFSGVSCEQLAAYYRARYVPNNITVVVVGDVDPAAVQTSVVRHFGTAPRAPLAPVLVPGEPGQLAPRDLHRDEEVEISRAVVSWQVPGLTHPDAPVLDLLAMVLGHGDSSLLWQELREKAGLVHTIDASCWNPGSAGLFCVAYTTDADKRPAADAAIGRLLARAASRGFPAAELRKALRQFVSGEVSVRQTMSGQASRIGVAEVVVGDLGYSRGYFERLRSVVPADLSRAIRTHLVASRRTSVSIDPAAAAKTAPAPAATGGGAPDFSETRLPNGARLLLQHDPRLPNVHIRLLASGGPTAEDPGKRGATALLVTLLTKDTRARTAAAIARFIEETGGSFYPFSGNNSLGVAAQVLPTAADRALEVVAGAVLSPAFKPATVLLERDAQLAALRQDADEVVTLARKLLRRRFFGAHPLALDAQGDEAGVAAIGASDLAALHRRLFTASNVVLSVAGDFDRVRFVPKLKAFLRRLPAGPAHGVARDGDSLPAAPGDFVERRDKEQAVVLQAFPAPPIGADDFYVGEVADELFSGMASRLFERVRENKGLAYFVRSGRVMGRGAAMFCFFAGTRPGKEAEVLAEIEAEIARVESGGVEEVELRRCVTRLKAARRQSLQTLGSRTLQSGIDVLQGRPANDWKAYDGRVEAVTIADLARFAGRYFQRARRIQLVVGP